ncbi:Uncharacterised protein [Chlamydia trachomatis]|nr:Uncharacterised protein [Chlamydia trachomatis]
MLTSKQTTEMLGNQEECDVVDVGRQAESRCVLFKDGSRANDACVRDDQVDTTGDLFDFLGHRGHGFFIRNVDGDRVSGLFAQFLALGSSAFAVQVSDVDEATLVDEAFGDLSTEALCTTGNQRDTTGDFTIVARSRGDLVGFFANGDDDRKFGAGKGRSVNRFKVGIEGQGCSLIGWANDDRASKRTQKQASKQRCVSHV